MDLDHKDISEAEAKKNLKKLLNQLSHHRRLANLLPEKHMLAYHDTFADAFESQWELSPDGAEIFARMHLVLDFIAGMTDRFALDLFQRLEGSHLSLGRQ